MSTPRSGLRDLALAAGAFVAGAIAAVLTVKRSDARKRKQQLSLLDSEPVRRHTGLRVKESTIKGAGRGLFAERDFAAGATLCRYHGRLLSAAEIKRHDVPDWPADAAYSMCLDDGVWIDAIDLLHVHARFINDADAARHNVQFVKHSRLLCADVVALRDIKAGEELFVSYGPDYWVGKHQRG